MLRISTLAFLLIPVFSILFASDSFAQTTSSPTKTSTTKTTTAGKPTSTSSATQVKSITGTYWKVVELNGKNVEGQTAKEMYFLLDPDSPQFKAHSGCKLVIGEAKRSGTNLVRFTNLINTAGDCTTPGIDADFTVAVKAVTQYAISGNTLQLKKDATTVLIKCVAK